MVYIVPMNDNNGLLGRRGRDELDNTEYWKNMFLWKLMIKPMTVQGDNRPTCSLFRLRESSS